MWLFYSSLAQNLQEPLKRHIQVFTNLLAFSFNHYSFRMALNVDSLDMCLCICGQGWGECLENSMPQIEKLREEVKGPVWKKLQHWTSWITLSCPLCFSKLDEITLHFQFMFCCPLGRLCPCSLLSACSFDRSISHLLFNPTSNRASLWSLSGMS